MFKYVVFIGAGVQIVGIFFYIKETIRGNTRPNKVSWLIWAVAPIIATAAALSDGVTWATFPVFIAGLTALFVFFASFYNPRAYWKLESFDYICGICSFLALILWAITKAPLVAIIFSIASYAFAAVPTIIKSWKYPKSESIGTYAAGLFNSLTAFFALRTFGISELAFPIYLVLESTVLTIAVYRGRFLK